MADTGHDSVTEVTGAEARPRLGVSSCLLGEPVRFNGGHSRCRFLTDDLAPHVDWVPYCPEMEIGLGAPRETLRLTVEGHLVSRGGGADQSDGALPWLAGQTYLEPYPAALGLRHSVPR